MKNLIVPILAALSFTSAFGVQCWMYDGTCTPSGAGSWCSGATLKYCEQSPRATQQDECGNTGITTGTYPATCYDYTGLQSGDLAQSPCSAPTPANHRKIGCTNGTTCCYIKDTIVNTGSSQAGYNITLITGGKCGCGGRGEGGQ